MAAATAAATLRARRNERVVLAGGAGASANIERSAGVRTRVPQHKSGCTRRRRSRRMDVCMRKWRASNWATRDARRKRRVANFRQNRAARVASSAPTAPNPCCGEHPRRAKIKTLRRVYLPCHLHCLKISTYFLHQQQARFSVVYAKMKIWLPATRKLAIL